MYIFKSNYPARSLLSKLAKELDFSVDKIESWFKNKRRMDSHKGILKNQVIF